MKFIQTDYKKNAYRAMRISQELKKAISNILQNRFNDPRVNFFTTVSMVKVSRDLSYAKVFVSYIDNSVLFGKYTNYSNEILYVLHKSVKFIRSILCKIVKLRKIPMLIFYRDNSLIQGMKIVNLLKKI